MNPELTLQNLFVEFTPVKIKKSEVGGRKDRRLEVEKVRRQEYGSRKDRSLEGEKIRS